MRLRETPARSLSLQGLDTKVRLANRVVVCSPPPPPIFRSLVFYAIARNSRQIYEIPGVRYKSTPTGNNKALPNGAPSPFIKVSKSDGVNVGCEEYLYSQLNEVVQGSWCF